MEYEISARGARRDRVHNERWGLPYGAAATRDGRPRSARRARALGRVILARGRRRRGSGKGEEAGAAVRERGAPDAEGDDVLPHDAGARGPEVGDLAHVTLASTHRRRCIALAELASASLGGEALVLPPTRGVRLGARASPLLRSAALNLRRRPRRVPRPILILVFVKSVRIRSLAPSSIPRRRASPVRVDVSSPVRVRVPRRPRARRRLVQRAIVRAP